MVQYNLFAYALNGPVLLEDYQGQFAVESILTGAFIGGIVGAAWGGFTAALTGDDIIAGAFAGGISGAVSGAFGGIHAVSFVTENALLVGRAAVGCATGLWSYWYTCSKNGAEMNLTGVLTAMGTGAATSAFAGANMFSNTPALAATMVNHISTGSGSLLTTIAHTVGQSKQSGAVSKTASSSIVVKKTPRYRHVSGRGCNPVPMCR